MSVLVLEILFILHAANIADPAVSGIKSEILIFTHLWSGSNCILPE